MLTGDYFAKFCIQVYDFEGRFHLCWFDVGRQEILRLVDEGTALQKGSKVYLSKDYAAQLRAWLASPGAATDGLAREWSKEAGEVRALYRSQSQCLILYHIVFPSGLYEAWYTSDELEAA